MLHGSKHVEIYQALRFWPIRFPHRTLWQAAVVFGASVAVTLVFWVLLPADLRGDEGKAHTIHDYSTFYEPVARRFLAGQGLTLADGSPAVLYPPGYPLLLSGVFGVAHLSGIPEEVAHAGFVLLCMGLSSVLLFLSALTLWGPRGALVSSLIWMTYPFALWLTKQPRSEVPFLVAFYGGFYLFCVVLRGESRRWGIYFCTGVLLGFAMLVRPIALGATTILAFALWPALREVVPRLRLFLIGMMLLGSAVAVLPWEVWTYVNTGGIVPLGAIGPPSVIDGLTFAVETKGYREGITVPGDVEALMRDVQTWYTGSQSVGEIASYIAGEFQARPATVAKLMLIKATRSWYSTDSGRFEPAIMALQVIYVALALWGSIAAWRRGGHARHVTIAVWLLVLYFWLMAILALPILRYMVPVIGLLFVLIPGAFARWLVPASPEDRGRRPGIRG